MAGNDDGTDTELDVSQILAEYRRGMRGRGLRVEEIADAMGVARSTLERMLNPDDRYTLGVDKLIPFLRAVGELTLLDHIERRLGRVAISVRPAMAGMNAPGMCTFMRAAGEAMTVIAQSMEDGRVTRAEARECRREVMELMQVLMGLLASLDQIEAN